MAPVSQAQSERWFSSACAITTKKRNILGVDNVLLLVTLKNSWTDVESFEEVQSGDFGSHRYFYDAISFTLRLVPYEEIPLSGFSTFVFMTWCRRRAGPSEFKVTAR